MWHRAVPPRVGGAAAGLGVDDDGQRAVDRGPGEKDREDWSYPTGRFAVIFQNSNQKKKEHVTC